MLPPHSSFSPRLLRWYDRVRRELPWRADGNLNQSLEPYHILLSEMMLQQTQVSTVVPYFNRFLQCFPTISSLAAADEQDVLRLWQGLGYYSRAQNLHAAAKKVVSEMGGRVPGTAAELLELPGVGRYTAGAIASIAFGERAPIVDGNVQRVLCRIDRITGDPRNRETQKELWRRAEEILPRKRVGDFNSALMELGATVCTPRSPQCLLCPVRDHCQAFAAGVQEQIPAPKKSRPTPLVHRRTYCIQFGDHWLIEQRPARGRWAGMWQFVTVPAQPDGNAVAELPIRVSPPVRLGEVAHTLTHRRYRFEVFVCEASEKIMPINGVTRRWTTLEALHEFPLSRPQLKIAEMLEGF